MRQLKITKQITGRESYSIEKYLQEIGKIHVLSPEEEADLAKKISGKKLRKECNLLEMSISLLLIIVIGYD